MTNPVFKKTIFISLAGHLAVLSIFSFSFGNSILKLDYAAVSFWGPVLRNSQVVPSQEASLAPETRISFGQAGENYLSPARDAAGLGRSILTSCGIKPQFARVFHSEKETFFMQRPASVAFARKKEPAIIFHPALPYGFTLYFKDRQIAHVELMYKIISAGARNSVLLKRKISSGNLEVDLLVMRYIGHLLFIQPGALMNNWQNILIDLSARND